MVCGQLYRWYLNPQVLQRPFEAGSEEKLFWFVKGPARNLWWMKAVYLLVESSRGSSS